MNFGKRGTSISVGPRGARMTFGNGRTTVSSGIPGTGIYYRQTLSSNKRTTTRHTTTPPGPATPKRINSFGWLLMLFLGVPSAILMLSGHFWWGALGMLLTAGIGAVYGQEPKETPQATAQRLANLKNIEQMHLEYERRKPIFDEASRLLDAATTMSEVDQQIAVCQDFMMWTYDMKDAGALFTMPCTREESMEKISICYNHKCCEIAQSMTNKCTSHVQAKSTLPKVVEILTKVREGSTKTSTLIKLQQLISHLNQL